MYVFKTTEQNNEKANDYETKALLYLLSFRKDSNSIETFAVDCFNDITGCSSRYNKLWDVQSKNVKSLNPKKIGISLITLYCNFEHEFPFKHFILVMPKLKQGYLKNEDEKIYDITNFEDQYIDKIKQGLQEEFHRREYRTPDNENLDKFLNEILFVIAEDSKINYVKNITKFKTTVIQDRFFEDIFNEIRDRQTAYKNIPIHNNRINTPSEIKNTKKIFKRNDFDALIINRFIGFDLFNNLSLVPLGFIDEIKNEDTESRKDIIQNAHSEIARMLFDKNNKIKFWHFFENLIEIIRENGTETSNSTYKLLLTKEIIFPDDLSRLTIIYLISLIKDGWQDEE